MTNTGIARKSIYRQCLVCRQMFDRSRLIRIVHNRNKNKICVLEPGHNGSMAYGRSAYLCVSEGCLSMALKAKKIQKALKTSIPDDIFRYLNDVLKGLNISG